MESTKMLIDKSEYDDLCRKEIRLEMIRRGMENYLKIFNSSDSVYLENDFLVILRAVFPFDYEKIVADLKVKRDLDNKIPRIKMEIKMEEGDQE